MPERFWSRVERGDGCWNWSGAHIGSGYASFRDDDGRYVLAHRKAYELLVGPIPSGLQIDHLCRNRGCVNPQHLEPVTQRVNILRGTAPGGPGANAHKTHCKRGHAFDERNTYVIRVGEGARRTCRSCQLENVKRYQKRKGIR